MVAGTEALGLVLAEVGPIQVPRLELRRSRWRPRIGEAQAPAVVHSEAVAVVEVGLTPLAGLGLDVGFTQLLGFGPGVGRTEYAGRGLACSRTPF